LKASPRRGGLASSGDLARLGERHHHDTRRGGRGRCGRAALGGASELPSRGLVPAGGAQQRDVTLVEVQQGIVPVQRAQPTANLQRQLGEQPVGNHWILPLRAARAQEGSGRSIPSSPVRGPGWLRVFQERCHGLVAERQALLLHRLSRIVAGMASAGPCTRFDSVITTCTRHFDADPATQCRGKPLRGTARAGARMCTSGVNEASSKSEQLVALETDRGDCRARRRGCTATRRRDRAAWHE
jgi:hypothetical protein